MRVVEGQLFVGKRRSVLGSGFAALALLAHASTASAAPGKDECVDANAQAQDLRRDGKLLSAREALRVCVNEICPKLVREDCSKRLDELTSVVPSVVFAAKDSTGRDLSAVVVTMDGKPLADHLDGAALEMDPGSHSFGFTTEGLPTVTRELLIREGERGRHETVLFGAAAVEQPPPPEPKSADATRASDSGADGSGSTSGSTQRIVAWTALGLGAAGIVVGSVFGLKSISKHDDAKACAATCPDLPSYEANEDARKFGTISTVAFVVGAVGVASGVTLWLTAKPNQTSSSAVPRFGIGLGSVRLQGVF
ncbi:MAG TPA: hypothetical protein VFK05_01220 [Polyangiaceae bacterium]|nr:hypothetical protein [Polyangiaceae bacterium]